QCVADDTATVTFHGNPAAVLPDKVKFCKDTDQLTILDAGAGTGYTYQWNAPSGVVLDSNNTRTIAAKDEGYFSVIVTNTFNCPTEDSVFVDVLCPPRVFVPNAFTPGITGEDQTFRVFGDYFVNFRMEVY